MAQNPHSENLIVNCKTCHTTDGWEFDQSFWNFLDPEIIKKSIIEASKTQKTTFNPYLVKILLIRQRESVNCKLCDPTLIFGGVACHEHNDQNEVESDRNDVVPNYQYSSTACLERQPYGNE